MIIKKNSLLISIFLLFFTQQLFANEKIGTVNKIEGNLKAINESGEERELSVYDELYLLDEIVSSNGGATIQFDDNSTIILKNNTSFKVTEFNISGAKDIFIGETIKGSVIVESGKIAKSDSGFMQIKLPKMDLEVKGTRFNIENKPDGTSDVGLSKDSFGNVGTINIAAEGAVKTLYSPDQVVSISEGQGFTERPQSDEEKQSMETVSQDLVEASKIDENEIQKQLEKKLLEGKLEDADGDGKIDLNDIAAIKQSIKEEKQEQINFIVDNSKEDNTAFLSEVLNSSDEGNVGEVMNKIVENNDALISQVVSDLSDKDNKFITGSDSEVANQIKEKVFEKIVQSGSDKSAEVLSKVIAKSDPKTVESVITNITTKNTDTNSALSLKVMADLAEKNPEALEVVNQNNKEQMEKLVVDAVQKGSSDEGSANLIAKVVSSASADVTNKMISEVSNNSSGANSDLSAKVLKAIVETVPDKIATIDNNLKEKVIEQVVVSAATSKDKNNDFGNVISDVIVKSDAATAAKVMEKVTNSNDSSGLALKVMASVSEKDSKKLEEVSKNDSAIVDKLIKQSVNEIKSDNANDAQLLAKVMSNSNAALTDKMFKEVSDNSTGAKSDLSAVVLKAVVETNPEKIETIDESVKNKVLEQAIVSASKSTTNNDFGNVISDVIVKSDAATAAKVMEKVTNSNDSSGLALKVMASVSEKDSKKLEEVSKNDSTIVNKLIEKSVKDIKGAESEVKLLAKVISKSTDQKLTEKVLVETAKKSTTDKTLMANVATAMIKESSNSVQSLATTISANQNIIENIANNPEVIKLDNISSVFAKNVSPN